MVRRMTGDADLNLPSGSLQNAGPADNFDDEFNIDEEICRVCRVSGEGTLYHPCLCAGSIKYVHQECLLQWLKYSKKEVCELCNFKFAFKPVYAENMPKTLPAKDVLTGLLVLFSKFLKAILMYIFVGFCWLVLVPLIASRTHQVVFSGLISSIFSTKFFSIFSLDNIAIDILRGYMIMSLFVLTFIALVWLKEQINVGIQEVNVPVIQQPEPVAENNVEPEVREDFQNEINALLVDDEIPRAPQINLNHVNLNNVVAVNPPPIEEIVIPAEVPNERRDVEQFVENMTWQRLLGLDGSFVFIENVFWVISLNFVFHIVFLLFPSLLGSAILGWMGLNEQIHYFKTAISVFVGYFMIIQVIYFWHCIFKKLQVQSMATFTHISYLIIKVLLLVITELIVFPIICGWWLDLCSLSLTGSSLNNRLKTFHTYPASSTVLHWLAGMLYVFYSASFILSLRDMLRPGVLWFIRNLNDPDFSPINEMIEQPFPKHLRRLVASTTLFLSIIFLVVYCPLRIIKACTSNIIPYILSSSENQFGGFSLELMLLQVVLPTTLEHMKAHDLLKYLVKVWCIFVGGWLQLDSYLLSESDRIPNNEAQNNDVPVIRAPQNVAPQPNNLADRHHALLVGRENHEVQSYVRPNHFQLRLVVLLICLSITVVSISLLMLTVPVSVGRVILNCAGIGMHSIHDIYSVGIGFYACWLFGKLCLVASDWFERGRDYVLEAVKKASHLLLRVLLATIPVLGIIPFLLSFYFQLLIIGPLRVSISQTPIFFPLKEWAMGILHMKIICATIMMGPEWWMKTSLEQIYADGIRGIRLRTLYVNIILPTINTLLLLIVTPYIAVRSVLLCVDFTPEENATIVRFSFPALLISIIGIMYLKWAYNKLCSLHKRLRDEKYLIGSQLVNFYRPSTTSSS